MVGQLTEVSLCVRWYDRELAGCQPEQRRAERHHAALELDQLPLQLVDPLHFPLAAASKRRALSISSTSFSNSATTSR